MYYCGACVMQSWERSLLHISSSAGAAVGPLLAGLLSAQGWDQVFYMLMTADFLALLVSWNGCRLHYVLFFTKKTICSFSHTDRRDYKLWKNLKKHHKSSPYTSCTLQVFWSHKILENRLKFELFFIDRFFKSYSPCCIFKWLTFWSVSHT